MEHTTLKRLSPNPAAQMLLESVRLLEQTSPSTGGATSAEYRQPTSTQGWLPEPLQSQCQYEDACGA